MAIVPYEKQIAVNPVGRTVSQFSVNVPEADLSGIQRAAESIGNIGEEQMKTAADEAATLAAGQATIINSDGSYAVIETPNQFGAYAAGKFNAAVEKNYVDTVNRDLEMQYITISTNPALTAQDKISQMNAFQESTLKNVDPKYLQAITENSRRELAQRTLGVLNLDQAKILNQQEIELKNHSTRYLDSAIAALAAGPAAFPDADRKFGMHLSTERTRLELVRSGDVEGQLKIQQDIFNGAKWFSSTLNQIQNEGKGGTLSSSELETLINIFDGTQYTGDAAFGITPENAILNMTEETRKYFAPKLKVMLQQLNAENSEKAKDFKIDNLVTLLNTDRWDKTAVEMNSTSTEQVIAMTKFLDNQGIKGGPFSSAAVIALSRATKGDLPPSLFDPFLNGILTLDPKTEGERAKNILSVYNQMKYVPDGIDGRGNIDATNIVDIKTRFILESLNTEINVNKVAITPALEKVMAIAKNTEADSAKINQNLFETFDVKDSKDLFEKLIGDEAINIPVESQSSILSNAQYGSMLGSSKEEIIKQVRANFNNEWKKSQYVFTLNGNGYTNADIPYVSSTVIGDTNPTQDWVIPYIELVKEDFSTTGTEYDVAPDGTRTLITGATVMAKQGFNIPLDKLEFGKNLFLVPTGSPDVYDETGVSAQKYNLYYKDSDKFLPLRNNLSRPITIIPAKAAALYQQHINKVRLLTANDPSIKVAPPYFAEPTTTIIGFRGGASKSTQPLPTDFDPDTVFKFKLEDMALPSTFNGTKVSVSKAAEPWMSIISEAATANGIGSDVQEIVKMIGFESQFDPDAKNKLSSASGLGQMLSSTWKERGAAKGLERTPENELKVSIEYMAYLKRLFENDFKRKPNLGEWYIFYNQGPSGGPALLKADPNSNAIQTISRFYSDPRTAVDAIINNLPKKMKNTNITSGQVVKYLKSTMGY